MNLPRLDASQNQVATGVSKPPPETFERPPLLPTLKCRTEQRLGLMPGNADEDAEEEVLLAFEFGRYSADKRQKTSDATNSVPNSTSVNPVPSTTGPSDSQIAPQSLDRVTPETVGTGNPQSNAIMPPFDSQAYAPNTNCQSTTPV